MAHPYKSMAKDGSAVAAKRYAGGGAIKKIINAVGDKYKDLRHGEKFTRDAEGKATGYNAERVYRDAGIDPATGDSLPARNKLSPGRIMDWADEGRKSGGKVKR